MTTRRSFLAMCGLAPLAAISPAPRQFASGGYARSVASSALVGESILPIRPSETLKLDVDTSAFEAAVQRMRDMGKIADVSDQLPAMYAGVPIDPGPAGFDNWPPSPLTWSGHAAGSRGDWMQLSSGRAFFPMDPRPEEIHIEDIAAALSKLCRFGGHTRRFYSVAEHCVHVANAAWPQIALDALLHDASEAYLSDVIRPIKPFLSNYREIEERLEAAIAERFGLDWPMPAEIKRLDNAILADERDQAMATPPADWRLPEPPLGVTLQFWSPEKAEYEFLAAFRRLAG